jgi:hypothetical protein
VVASAASLGWIPTAQDAGMGLNSSITPALVAAWCDGDNLGPPAPESRLSYLRVGTKPLSSGGRGCRPAGGMWGRRAQRRPRLGRRERKWTREGKGTVSIAHDLCLAVRRTPGPPSRRSGTSPARNSFRQLPFLLTA